MLTFAEILKKKREAAGMTRMGLARLVEVTPSSITLYEQGKREPSWIVIQRLADAFGVSTEVFRTVPKGEPAVGARSAS